MAKIFTCQMTRTVSFQLKADDEEAAMNWVNSHSQEFVMNETKAYDIEHDDSVIEESHDPDAAKSCIDISESF